MNLVNAYIYIYFLLTFVSVLRNRILLYSFLNLNNKAFGTTWFPSNDIFCKIYSILIIFLANLFKEINNRGIDIFFSFNVCEKAYFFYELEGELQILLNSD